MFSLSSQIIQSISTRNKIPYDVLNRIFDYLSDISESGWRLQLTNRGKMILSANPLFSDIQYLLQFKMQSMARPVNLIIKRWDTFHTPENIDSIVVSAIEHPYRIHPRQKIDESEQNGIVFDNRCYTYSDPETEQNMVAYIEIRKFGWANNAPMFHQGCVYDATGDSKVISGFSSDVTPGNVRMIVNPYGIVWDLDEETDWALDFEGNPNWEEEMEADALGEFEQFEQIDFEELPPLQMYM